MQTQQITHLFNSLGPVNGKLSGKSAHAFLLTSNLPPHSLKDIWCRADQDQDGQLTLHEFSVILQLIQNYKRGLNAAAINSMNSIPLQQLQHSMQQHQMQHQLQMQQSMQFSQQSNTSLSRSDSFKSQQTIPTAAAAAANWSSFSSNPAGRMLSPMKAGTSKSTVPASISNEMWVVDLNAKKRYLTLFNRLDNRRTGSVPGSVVKGEFVKSGLSAQVLSQIWSLSDISKTGTLSADEFCVAMYLVENAQRGKDPPPALTPAVVPPQYRHFLLSVKPETQPDSIFTKASFEDKKQQNFDKGEAELERRRLERLRKEEEDREAEAAASQELERQKAALHARRQLEFQKQRTKSLEVAAQLKQQQEEEQQTLYRSKMESWAESRKQQLEGQLGRLRELTTGLRTRKILLDKELADLVGRRDKSRGTLDNFLDEKTRIYLDIEKLNRQRQQIINEVSSARSAVHSSQIEFSSVGNDRVRLSQQMRARRNPDEVLTCILEEQEKAKQSVISLRSEYAEIVRKTAIHEREHDEMSASRQDIVQLLKDREKELASKQALLAELTEKKRQYEASQRAEQARKQEAEDARRMAKEKALKEAEKAARERERAVRAAEAAAREREKADQERFKEEEQKRQEMERKKAQEEAHKLAEEDKILTEFERTRLQSIKFNELQSDELGPRKSIDNSALAKKLASEARAKKQERLVELVEEERKRSTFEKEEFYARASSLPRTPQKRPDGARKFPQKLETPAKAPGPAIDCLISFDTPQQKAKPKPDYLTDLSSILSPTISECSAASTSAASCAAHTDNSALQVDMPGGAEMGDTGGDVYQNTLYQSNTSDDYSIYMNVDPTGLLRSPTPSNTPSNLPSNLPGNQEYAPIPAHRKPTTGQDGEHIYALASDVVQQSRNLDVLFEVEALVDHRGASSEELTYCKGDRISVYEVRENDYFAGIGVQTGTVAIGNTEKCEWIYGDIEQKEVVALYDYQSDVEGDLCFSTGDVITVTEDLGEWYRGYVGHRTGIFPGNFVQDRDQPDGPPPTSALPTEEIKPISTGIVLETYATEQIELEKGETVSVLAQADDINIYIQNASGKRAWVRTDLLKLEEEIVSDVSSSHQNGPIGADRIPASLHCFSLYPYTAQNNDELTLRVNDVITITEQSDPHWWIGRSGAEVGVLPANYVEQINDQVTWDTVKAWNSNLSAAEDERTRQEAIHELISTEKTYIDDLLLVVEVFYNPLCSVASEEELSSVFVNWMQLILCNARLFRALYNTNDVNCFETVGAVFLEEVESLLAPYTRFCSAQRQAMLALQESVSPMFKAKEKECATSPKVGKLPLSTFLLKPMQRITKYPLLIKKILQHTRDSHPDYTSLRDSLTRTEYLLTSVNEAVRATSRLETLERAFVKCSEELGERVKLHSATNCLGPRKLLHFGSLSKTKGSKEMFAVLFTDMLWISKVDKGRYGNKPIDLDARDFDSVKFEYYRDPFMLNNMVMTEGVKVPEQTFQFVYNDKNYCFFCNSASDAADWSDHLHGAIRNAVLLYHSNYKVFLPDPTVSGQATLTLRIVEALELSLPPDEKPTSLFAQASLHGHVQRTPVGGPKWDHTVHFVINDLNSDKINISVYKEFVFSPNMLLGKFDLSIQKLIKSGPGPWNKRLILTDTNSGMVNVSILLRYHANR